MKRFILFLSAIIITVGILAQTPQGISHQAVMRDSENNLIVESTIGLKVSIIQGTHDGVAVYVETHNVMTNKNGLISYVIGDGSMVQGVFQDIDWSDGPYWLETKADPVGGTNYTISGVTMFLSVPYALHAQTAEDYSETDPLFTEWDKSEGIVITEDQISDLQEYVVEESDPLFTSAFSINDAQDGDLLIYDGTLGQWVRFTPEYLTDFDETDPLFTASPASGILSDDIENWDEAFSWGDHGEEGYLKSETDPLFTAWDRSEGITITESQIMDFGEYVEAEADPLFTASPASGILSGDIENWDAAFDWGDHGEEGYLKSETDPLFTAWDRSEGITITESQIMDFGEYVESETDPLFSSAFNMDDAQDGDLLIYDETFGQWVGFTPDYMTTITGFSDEFSASAGQTAFELSHTPHTNSNIKLFINGIRISNAAYSLVGSTVTYHPENNGSFDLTDGDRVQFDYFF